MTTVRTVRMDAEEIEIPVGDVARYLGLGKASPDEALLSLIEESLFMVRPAHGL